MYRIYRHTALVSFLAAAFTIGAAAQSTAPASAPKAPTKAPIEASGKAAPAVTAPKKPIYDPNAVVLAPTDAKRSPNAPDLTKDPTLYVVGYAHLDTEWRWDYPQVIDEYLKNTLDKNFDLIQKYPHYIFNFTGANRFEMFKEYYPAQYQQLKTYIQQGRWFPGGSSMEENDVNAPNAESIIRQVLYGNEYFRKEFGVASYDYMLPDCFGFPASLPTILSHAGLLGFSTQKLSAGWQPAPHVGGPDSPEKTPQGIPFNVGIWTGPDGKSIIGAVNPGSYSGSDTTDLSKNPLPELVPYANGDNPVDVDGKLTGIYSDFHYVGTGDVGGSPSEDSVKIMEATMTKGMAVLPLPGRGRGGRGRGGANAEPPPPNPPQRLGEGPINVKWADTDSMFVDMKDMDLSKLPKYSGDLELINHSAGSLTSEAEHKRWNRNNEVLAGAAEVASVGANWLGARPYPQDRLNYAWRLILGGQFHDIMAGTAEASAYTYSWNDDIIASNQLAIALTSATQGIAQEMDTAGPGTPLVVYNDLNIARQDPVEANVPGNFDNVRVTGPDGAAVPAQVLGHDGGNTHILFIAKAPSMGYAVYNAESAAAAPASELKVTNNSLENARYTVTLNQAGDVSSVFDKRLNKELLQGPMRLSFQTESPTQWPAWNMDWDDQKAAPRAYVSGPATVTITENGDARVAVQIVRDSEGSHFVQTVRLAAGDAGNRVEFGLAVDWKTAKSALMADFPMTASDTVATYNWDFGTIQRTNDDDRKFEVASHQWVDLTDQSRTYGATVLTDVKNASDKPNDNTVRLTLLYTPGLNRGQALPQGSYSDQATQDWGHHDILFGLSGHDGDWRQGQTDWQAYRLNAPLMAFTAAKHAGPLGKSFSLLRVDNPRIRVTALKKAEESNEVVVRMVEMDGQMQPSVHVGFAGRVTAAREINGQEQPLPGAEGKATVVDGALVTSFTPYQPRSFAVKLAAPAAAEAAPKSQAIALDFNRAAASNDGARSSAGIAGMDSSGNSLPAEMLPATVNYSGVQFKLGPSSGNNAVVAQGQLIAIPAGYNRVYILAAADGDQTANFQVGNRSTSLNIQNWTGYIGQWDYRDWEKVIYTVPVTGRGGQPPAAGAPTTRDINREIYAGLNPGYIKRAPVAWFASHHHDAQGKNIAYSYSYLFAYALDVPNGATTLTLPNNGKIVVMAVTAANQGGEVAPAAPLYDMLPSPTLTPADRSLLYTKGHGADYVEGAKSAPSAAPNK